jgi:hypothetical protein
MVADRKAATAVPLKLLKNPAEGREDTEQGFAYEVMGTLMRINLLCKD